MQSYNKMNKIFKTLKKTKLHTHPEVKNKAAVRFPLQNKLNRHLNFKKNITFKYTSHFILLTLAGVGLYSIKEAFDKPDDEPTIIADKKNKLKCILLAGPGDEAFNYQSILKIEKALKMQELDVLRIGDGVHTLNAQDRANLLNAIAKSPEHLLLFIKAQGDIINGKHGMKLYGDNPHSSSTFINDLSHALNGKPIDIFSTVDFGGALSSYAKKNLPKNSSYIALAASDQSVPETNINYFMNFLATNNIAHGNVLVEKLLLAYLTKVRIGHISPVIALQDAAANLDVKFVYHLGKKFTEAQKQSIFSMLADFASLDSIKRVSEIIENKYNHNKPSSISAADYGLALAICHAANRDMECSTISTIRNADKAAMLGASFDADGEMVVSRMNNCRF